MKNSGNIIDRLHEDEMLYFILGTLISADNLVDHQACVESMTCLQRLRDDFLISSLKDDQHLRKMLDLNTFGKSLTRGVFAVICELQV